MKKTEKIVAEMIIHLLTFIWAFSVGVGLYRDLWGTLFTLSLVAVGIWAMEVIKK